MKTYSLDFTERMRIVAILNAFKGTLADTAVVIDDLKALAATEEEAVEAKLELVPHGGAVSPQWNSVKGAAIVKEVSLSDTTKAFVSKWFEEKDAKGEFTLADAGFTSIRDKFK